MGFFLHGLLFLVVSLLQFGLYEADFCASSVQCGANQACSNGFCVDTVFEPFADIPRCTQASDCPGAGVYECIVGVCREVFQQLGSTCSGDYECTKWNSNLKCIYRICVPSYYTTCGLNYDAVNTTCADPTKTCHYNNDGTGFCY